jgi:ribosome-interacting GTPase 1
MTIQEQINNVDAFLNQLDIGGDEFELKIRERMAKVREELQRKL